MDGPVAVAIPRTFKGHIYINQDSESTLECPYSDASSRLLHAVPRNHVYFSPEIQEFIKTESEQRRLAKGRYFLGLATDQREYGYYDIHFISLMITPVEPKEHLDSLYIDSRNGTISVFYVTNPSFGLTKPDNTIFGKLMTKARS